MPWMEAQEIMCAETKANLILPLVQSILAWELLTWRGGFIDLVGDTRALCVAISAPIAVFLAPLYAVSPIRWMPQYILRVRSDIFIILIAVVILWLGIGFVLDRIPLKKDSHLNSTPVQVSLCACGLWLLLRVALDWFSRTDSEGQHALGDIIDGIITIGWALTLITPLATKVMGLLSRRSGHANS